MINRSTDAVLVTGATSGIGASICRLLSNEGYAIYAHFHRDALGADLLQAAIRDGGGACETFSTDLGRLEGPSELADAVAAELSREPGMRLHGIVNNAATVLGPPLEAITAADFDRFVALNTRAPLMLVKELLPHLSAGASIVNISSASAHISSSGNLLYAMTKSALESLTKNLAAALASTGVRVNAVVPGYTDNGHEAFRNPVALEYMSSLSALGGVASPAVVAEAARFLLSPGASRTTGSLLDVSGGTTLSARRRGAQSVRDVISG